MYIPTILDRCLHLKTKKYYICAYYQCHCVLFTSALLYHHFPPTLHTLLFNFFPLCPFLSFSTSSKAISHSEPNSETPFSFYEISPPPAHTTVAQFAISKFSHIWEKKADTFPYGAPLQLVIKLGLDLSPETLRQFLRASDLKPENFLEILLGFGDDVNLREVTYLWKLFRWCELQRGDFHHLSRSYEIIVSLLASAQMLDEAKSLLSSMVRNNMVLSDYSALFSGIIQAYAEASKVNNSLSLFDQARDMGLVLSGSCYHSLLNSLIKIPDADLVVRVYRDMINAGLGLYSEKPVLDSQDYASPNKQHPSHHGATFDANGGTTINLPTQITRYNTDDIMTAIEHGREVGQGATATVYYGVLEGREVAIKRFKPNYGQTFEQELRIGCTLDHPNILKMLGYSYGGGNERYIVYELMEKGSLDGEHTLTWKERVHVAWQIARGVLYLHHGIDGEMDLIHRDLKPENILLDKDLNACICDFGVAEHILKNDTTQVVENLAGTHGYIDYYNSNSGDVARGTDVFSFGGIMCDMLRGKNVARKDVPTEITDEEIKKLLDVNLLQVSADHIREVISLWRDCRGPVRENRPSILEVARRLEQIKNEI